jgi:hypothetical protein
VTKVTFDANTILAATADDTPAALTVAEQTLVGRITAGNIAALSATQVRTLINVEDAAAADQTAQEIANAIDADAAAETTLKSALGLGSAAYTDTSAYDAAGVHSLVAAPAGPSATGTAGQWAWTSPYLYICVATDTWLRIIPARTW